MKVRFTVYVDNDGRLEKVAYDNPDKIEVEIEYLSNTPEAIIHYQQESGKITLTELEDLDVQ